MALPEVEGGEGARLPKVVADEAGEKAAVRGGVRRGERRQRGVRIVQGDEIAVGLRRQAGGLVRGGGRGGRAPGTQHPTLSRAESDLTPAREGGDRRSIPDAGPERRREAQRSEQEPQAAQRHGVDRVRDGRP